jgi:diaminopimelate decarboxylase
LREAAEQVLALPAPFGFTPRYAMKANSNRTVLKLFDSMGLHIDASSGYEAERAMAAGIPGGKIQLTAQELPKNLKELVEAGVLYNACSLHQIEAYGKLFPGTALAVRINPGVSGAVLASSRSISGGAISSGPAPVFPRFGL